MTSRFLECFRIINSPEVEGRYSNHIDDYGGATNYGVTTEVFHEYLTDIGEPLRDVKTITQEEVQCIYRQYWDAAKCDFIAQPLDLLVFDVSINSGPNKAIVLLQRALGMNEKHHTGNFGPITTRTLATVLSMDGVALLCDRYLRERKRFYNNRVRLDPSQTVFFKGWMNRLDTMAKYAGIGKVTEA